MFDILFLQVRAVTYLFLVEGVYTTPQLCHCQVPASHSVSVIFQYIGFFRVNIFSDFYTGKVVVILCAAPSFPEQINAPNKIFLNFTFSRIKNRNKYFLKFVIEIPL